MVGLAAIGKMTRDGDAKSCGATSFAQTWDRGNSGRSGTDRSADGREPVARKSRLRPNSARSASGAFRSFAETAYVPGARPRGFVPHRRFERHDLRFEREDLQ